MGTIAIEKRSQDANLSMPEGAPSSAIKEYISSFEAASSKLITQALRDPNARSFLLTDTDLTIQAITGLKAVEGVSLKVVEDTERTINLVIPCPDGQSGGASASDLVSEILNDASTNSDLRMRLRQEPAATLNAELAARSDEGLQLNEELTVLIHEPTFGEVVLVLPPAQLSRIDISHAIETGFGDPEVDPIKMQTGSNCQSQAFTMCIPSCGLS